MLKLPQFNSAMTAASQFEAWIDAAVLGGHDVVDIAAGVIEVAQSGSVPSYQISPELLGNEGWYWPWNRAGFLCIDHHRPLDAVVLFKCAYLAALRFQHLGQYRIHKGTPLCNIAYAYVNAGQPANAALPALLGMVEDAITNANPLATACFKNLLASGFPEATARALAGFFLMLTYQRGLFPLYPEPVLESAQRANVMASTELIASLHDIAANLNPTTLGASLHGIGSIWGRLSGYIQGVMERGRTSNGEANRVTSAFAPTVVDAGSQATAPTS